MLSSICILNKIILIILILSPVLLFEKLQDLHLSQCQQTEYAYSAYSYNFIQIQMNLTILIIF